MTRWRWVVASAIVVLAVPGRAHAQEAVITVDDETPIVGQTVVITVTCPEGTPEQGDFLSMFGSITPNPMGGAVPLSFFASTLVSTHPVTFPFAGDFTISATCQYTVISGRLSPSS
jgi:hypothetical protein